MAELDESKIVEAWNNIVTNLDPCALEKAVIENVSSNEFAHLWHSVGLLKECCNVELIDVWFVSVIKERLTNVVVPRFWSYFSSDCDKNMTPLERVKVATFELYDTLKRWDRANEFIDEIHRKLSTNLSHKSFPEMMKQLYKGILLSQVSMSFENIMVQFYTDAFKAISFCSESLKDDEDTESLICNGCDKEVDYCECGNILSSFCEVNQKLCDLDLLERLAGEALTIVIHKHIEQHIQNRCKGNFETLYLSSLETVHGNYFLRNWLDTVVVGWLKTICCGKNRDNDSTTQALVENFRGRLMHFLYETYASVRMEEMFHIIIEYPESQPAVEDLKLCLEKTNLRSQLVHSLKKALETRLLHPGVNTNDILIAYTSTIKTLWMLDPTGVLLEMVCDPVHKYLRTRQDTVRCIVSSLTDDSMGELADELNKAEPLVLDDSYQSDDDAENWELWKPDPVDANPDKMNKSRRTSDIISMLVNIYGSKDMFVKEYRSLLADRILNQFNYEIHREFRYLELLKLRFGESDLHLCEVMLKDIADSKRITQHIHSDETYKGQSDFPLYAMILSAQFWPSLREERLQLPPAIQSVLDAFTKAFETLKGNRTMCWKPHLGLVSLEIELKDRTLDLQVSPTLATILLHFEQQVRWTLEELSSVMQIPSFSLKKKLAFWQSHGIIKEEEPDTYILLEEQTKKTQDIGIIEDEEETESAMASSHEQREEELQVFWSYIVGMLTNLESLPIERIHGMLKMFAVQSPTTMECNIHELKFFLDRKVKERKLVFSAGFYKLPKTNNT